MQVLTLIYFNYYILKFAQDYKNNKLDQLSIWCFVFVELTLFSKIILRSSAIIGIKESMTG